jgi:hypothetical protein
MNIFNFRPSEKYTTRKFQKFPIKPEFRAHKGLCGSILNVVKYSEFNNLQYKPRRERQRTRPRGAGPLDD